MWRERCGESGVETTVWRGVEFRGTQYLDSTHTIVHARGEPFRRRPLGQSELFSLRVGGRGRESEGEWKRGWEGNMDSLANWI